MLRIMYDNIQVAHREGEIGNFEMVLEDDIHFFYVPKDLFVYGVRRIPLIKLVEWLEDRVFPQERMGADKLLAEIGLKEYDFFKIAKITRVSLAEDGWWVAFEETDNFREHTIRGTSGEPEWESATLPKLKDSDATKS